VTTLKGQSFDISRNLVSKGGLSKSISSRYPIIFSKFREQNYFLLPYKIKYFTIDSLIFSFFLISNFKFNKKAQRGATLIHGKYTRVPLFFF
jgi:hypothetical protein